MAENPKTQQNAGAGKWPCSAHPNHNPRKGEPPNKIIECCDIKRPLADIIGRDCLDQVTTGNLDDPNNPDHLLLQLTYEDLLAHHGFTPQAGADPTSPGRLAKLTPAILDTLALATKCKMDQGSCGTWNYNRPGTVTPAGCGSCSCTTP